MKLLFLKNRNLKSKYTCSIGENGTIYFSKSLAEFIDFKENKNFMIAVNEENVWIDRIYFIKTESVIDTVEINFKSGIWKASFLKITNDLGLTKKQKMLCIHFKNKEHEGFEVMLPNKIYNINNYTKQC